LKSQYGHLETQNGQWMYRASGAGCDWRVIVISQQRP